MNVFIDESGIHKSEDHSSFVLVYVEVGNQDEIDNKTIKIEKDLNIEAFHWSNHGWVVRKKFLKQILKLPFHIKVAILENPFNFKKQFTSILSHLLIEKDNKNIYIDGRKPKWYQNQLKVALRNRGINFKRLRLVNDKSFPCLRLADTCAGFIRSYFDNPTEQKKGLFRKISQKITLRLEGQFAN